jgi:predicted NUDIX family NTP pyrophosphohydrolase
LTSSPVRSTGLFVTLHHMGRKSDISAGLLVYRNRGKAEVLLAHPGGPYWAKKDAGAWTIPKGLVEPGDELLATAQREFTEETGFVARGPFLPLAPVRQKSGKIVHAFAAEGDFDPGQLVSNTFELIWPPKSGRLKSFPEVDRLGWFPHAQAMEKLLVYQQPFLVELNDVLARRETLTR